MPRWTVNGMAAVFWLLFAAPALWLAHQNGWVVALDTDSAMRLAQVRDLLHGQAWSDTTQWRMNTPLGLPMHWSRLVDAPLALLIRLVSEKYALVLWPLLVLLPVLAALARIAERLAGPLAAITVLMLGLMAAEVDGLFAPGSIDHHNVQLALMLWTLVFLIEQRARLAAVFVALSLGVGLESLPYAVMAAAATAFWLKDDTIRARDFGLTLAASAAVLLFATTTARYRTGLACDTYSLFYAIELCAGGLGLVLIAQMPRHRYWALAGLAAGLVVLAAATNPLCLAGPYGGMDGRLNALFLSRVSEAESAFAIARSAPSEFVGAYAYACFALAAALFAPRGRPRLLVLAFAAMALVVASFQIRAVSFAILFALPGLAAALSRLKLLPSVAGLLLGSQVSFAAAGVLVEGHARQNQRLNDFSRQVDCGSDKAMALLRALRPGRAAAFVDQGPAVLVYTRDAAIAGPYHRDAAGILDTYAIFTGSDPRRILKARGISYVMTCAASPDWDVYRAKGGLIAELATGHTPAWLTPAGRSGDVAVYRVAR
jgi:hypothetical protein